MKQILKLVFLLVIGQTAFAQAPSNYTNINGRYRWIAGMFDSTFHIPKGTNPSLRTGGSTNAGALFYRTSDSTVRYWTGSQWLTLSDTTRFVPYVGATKDVDLDTWSLYAKSLHIKGTAGQGHLGLKFQSATPNMSANESGVYADANGNLGVKIDNAYTSIFKTNLNSADRTYTFQNKSYTVGDSSDIAARVKYTDTASMLSPYLRSNVASATYVPYTGATTSLDMGLFNIYGQNIVSNNYATGAAMSSISRSDVTANAYGTLLLKRGVWGTLQPNPLTAFDKNWYLPDTSGTLALASQLSGYVPTTRTITINGTSQDLSANRTYNVGTVTSVATSTGTGITGGTITSSGTIAADTLLLSTRAWRQKGIDSVAALANTKISGTGTTNYIPKFTSSSAIGNSIVTDDGTTVTVNGSSTVYFKVKASTNSGIDLLQDTGGTGYLFNRDNAGIVFGTNNAEKMRLASDGYLGIGSSGPQTKLDIRGTSNTSSATMQIVGNGVSTLLLGQNSDGGVIRGQGGNDVISFWTGGIGDTGAGQSGTERMRLTSTGLGIGTSSPAYKLDVAGRVNISNAASAWNSFTTNQLRIAGTASGQSMSISFTDNNNSNGWFGYKDDATAANRYFYWSANDGSSQQMILNSSGNLGLGVTPSAWSGYTGFQIGNQGSIGATSTVINFSQNVYYGASGNSYIENGKAAMYQMNDGVHGWRIAGTGTAGNAISFTQAMTLDASGNLALGQTSSALQSGGTGVTLYGTSASEIKFLNSSTGSAATDGTALVTSSLNFSINNREAGDILLGTSNTERMRITSAGNVGIGTTSPTSVTNYTTLDLRGTNGGIMYFGTTSTASFRIIGTGTDGYFDNITTGDLIFRTTSGNTERMRITSGGNVGIGTTSPNAYTNSTFLTINSGSTSSGLDLDISDTRTATFNTSATQLDVFTLTNIPMTFGTNSAERMRITSGGELLINTTSDAGDYKLQVNGNVLINNNNYIVGYLSVGTSLFRGRADFGGIIVGGNGGDNTSTEVLRMSRNGDDNRYQSIFATSSSTSGAANNIQFYVHDKVGAATQVKVLQLNGDASSEFGGSIKTAAPSGGTAKPYKWGEAGVAIGGSDGYAVKVEIDGTLYYLMTGYLPEPEPEAQAGPSMGYKAKFEEPVIKIKSDNQKIKDLEKEIAELKELIKSKIK